MYYDFNSCEMNAMETMQVAHSAHLLSELFLLSFFFFFFFVRDRILL